MILKRQNMSENNWNHFKIVPQGHNNCQLSIVNCQFGEAAKFQFVSVLTKADNHNPNLPMTGFVPEERKVRNHGKNHTGTAGTL